MQLTRTNCVEEAEKVVKKLEKNRYGSFILTTSKIRNLLNMVSDIYNNVVYYPDETLSDELVERIQYLKMRFAYEKGRELKEKEKPVGDLVKNAEIIEQIDAIGRSKEQCICFCRFMEAIVAYHKFYGGRD